MFFNRSISFRVVLHWKTACCNVSRRKRRQCQGKRSSVFGGHVGKREFPAITVVGWAATKVGIARALSNDPQLILADEPTGSLDPENALQSIDLLQSLCKERDCTLITVSHDPSIVERFDSSLRWEDLNQVVDTRHEP